MIRLLTLSFLLVVLAVGSFSQDAPLAELLPDHTYSILMKRTMVGNDGVRELIPLVSTQMMTITTSGATGAGVAVEFKTYLGQSIDTKNKPEEPGLEWHFTFTLTPDGRIEGIRAVTDEGEMPETVARSMLLSRLEGPMFYSILPLERPRGASIFIQKVGKGPGGAAEVEYVIKSPEDAEQLSSGSMVVETDGSAVYDAKYKFYVSRVNRETRNIIVPADETNPSKLFSSRVTTTYETTISKR